MLPTAPFDRDEGCHSWFPITAGAARGGGDLLAGAAAAVGELIAAECAVLAARGAASRVAVCGFSQGGALAYRVGLGAPPPWGSGRLAAVAALSAFVPPLPEPAAEALSTPVFIAHGTADDRIPGGAAGAGRAADGLRSRGFADVRLKVYGGLGHEASQEEVDDLLAFLRATLPPSPAARL